jgi:hypothetical protein
VAARSLDLGADRLGVVSGMVMVDNDPVAGLGRLQRQAPADASGRAGDQRAAPVGHRRQSIRPKSKRFISPMKAMKTMIIKIAVI